MKYTLIQFLFSLILLTTSLGGDQAAFADQPKTFEQSYYYENLGQYSKAISLLLTIYEKDSYEINLRLAWLNYLNGAYTESMSYYQKSIGIMPYSLEAKFGYVLPASAVGNWEQVIAKYKEVLVIDPKNKTANYRLGSIYYNREKYNEAQQHLKKVVNLYPFEYDSLLLFGWTNLKMGKTREAQILFQKVLLISANDASALEGMSLLQ